MNTSMKHLAYFVSRNSTYWDPGTNCTVWLGSKSQWTMLTTGSILINLTVVLANVFNLLVFYFWENKEPFVLFHVSLSLTAMFYGIIGAIPPISRSISWTQPKKWPYQVAVSGSLILHFTTLVNVTLISIDRWLSVEFAVQYRYYISTRKILLTIGILWIFSLLWTLPPLVAWRDCILVYCFKQPAFHCQSEGYKVYTVSKGPICLIIILLCQIRIIIIAVQGRLKIFRRRRIFQLSDPVERRIHEVKQVVELIWRNLLPGMAIVVATVISNVPYYVIEFIRLRRTDGGPDITFAVFVFFVQHICSTLIYLAFFRQYRNAAKRFCRICRGQQVMGQKFKREMPRGTIRYLTGSAPTADQDSLNNKRNAVCAETNM